MHYQSYIYCIQYIYRYFLKFICTVSERPPVAVVTRECHFKLTICIGLPIYFSHTWPKYVGSDLF
jgi:hypothetical protein